MTTQPLQFLHLESIAQDTVIPGIVSIPDSKMLPGETVSRRQRVKIREFR